MAESFSGDVSFAAISLSYDGMKCCPYIIPFNPQKNINVVDSQMRKLKLIEVRQAS